MWGAQAVMTAFSIAAAIALAACGGGGGDDTTEACETPIDLSRPTEAAAQLRPPVSFVTLAEAQELVDFEIALPAELPEDAGIRQVRLHHRIYCHHEVDYVAIVFSGPDYSISVEQSDRERAQIGGSTEPFRVGEIEGRKRVRLQYSEDRMYAVATWSRADLYYYAKAFLTGKLTEDKLFAILASVE